MQDRVVFAIQQGMDVSFVLDMDLLSFDSLHSSCVRLKAQQDTLDAHTAFRAAAGDGKDMQKWIDQNWKESSRVPGDAQANDLAAFLRDYPRGF